MADQYLGTPVTAFLVITLLTWAAVSVSGTTQELSTTTGDTVNIPCLFGEGTLLYILWYYNDGTGPRNILKLDNEELTIAGEYANRASLYDDYSTLILKGITVVDEGTYHCVVDTRKETAPSNIETKLNVFSLRPNTLPVISPCIWVDESSSCSIHTNQSFTLTCTLPNVYPVQETELIWYRDGKRVSSTDDVTQNDDGTTDISRRIKIYETGNFTCNATYLSAYGRENTSVSVEAWIIPPADPSNTHGKNLPSSLIAWRTMCIVLFVVIFIMAIIVLFFCILYFLKARVRRSFRRDKNEVKEILLVQGQRSPTNDELSQITSRVELNQPGSEDGTVTSRVELNQPGSEDGTVTSRGELNQAERSAENGSEDRTVTSREDLNQPGRSAENGSEDRIVTSREDLNQPGRSAENGSEDRIAISTKGLNLSGRAAENDDQNENVESPARPEFSSVRSRYMNSRITDKMMILLATEVPPDQFDILSNSLEIGYTAARNILLQYRMDYKKATFECIARWRNRTQSSVADLHEVMRAADLERLIGRIDWSM